jgi:hypothetical protein
MTLGCTKDPEENAICWLDTPATGKLDFIKMVKSRSRCFGDRVLLHGSLAPPLWLLNTALARPLSIKATFWNLK